MAHHILTTDTKQIIVRSMLRTASTALPNLGHEGVLQEEIKASQARQAKGEKSPVI